MAESILQDIKHKNSPYNWLLEFSVILVLLAAVWFSACETVYKRPRGRNYLGGIEELLLSEQYLSSSAMVVRRDEQGWGVFSARCTYKGCDLTFQKHALVCPCCGSRFDHFGKRLSGPAKHSLPWYALSYDTESKKFVADTGTIVSSTERFTTPELTKRVKEILQSQFDQEGEASQARVPKVLLGEGSKELGPMFREFRKEDLDQLHDIKRGENKDK